jgi:hypothetical protein
MGIFFGNLNRATCFSSDRTRKKRDGAAAVSAAGGWGVLALCLFAIFLPSCATEYSAKMYADVIGFNDNVIQRNYTSEADRSPYDLTNQSQARALENAIFSLPGGSNTAALYALDVGLDRIAEVQKKFMESDPKSKYYIVFFTDGLDNVSTILAQRNRRGNYDNASAYANVLQERMQNILKTYRFFGLLRSPNTTNSFQSYVLLYRGDDIRRSNYTEEELEARLQPFTGSQNEQRPVVIQGDNLEKLLEDFKNAFVMTSFSFVIPRGYAGQRIRMLLNAEDDPNPVYFEADLKRESRPKIFFLPFIKEDYYALENIQTSDGFTLEVPGGRIEMDKESYDPNSNTVPFLINNLKHGNSPYSVRREFVTQWFYDGGRLRLNSEYNSSTGSKKNAYILLIMDTSTSFASQIDAAKETAAAIVWYISEQM